MHYGNIKTTDIANGLGIRVSLFVSGCANHCEGCFQPETWNPLYGKMFTEATKQELLEALSKPYVDGLTILGGDPFYPDNVATVHEIIALTRKTFAQTRNIWLYSGYTYEELLDRNDANINDSLALADVLVDGRFILNKKDISLKFRGSSNQRIIDLVKTNASNSIVELAL